LQDATAQEDFHQDLLRLIECSTTLALADGEAAIRSADALAGVVGGEAERAPTAANELSLAVPSQHPSEVPPEPGLNSPVAPAPLTAQPGEAAAPPRSTTPASSAGAQRLQPRESPSAGDPVPHGGRLDARASTAFVQAHVQHRLPSRTGSAEQSNTSILYGKDYILKLFRRLQPGENPDVEIGRYLTESAHFSRIASFLGEISITPASGEKTTVAMLQQLIPNSGDGWEWFVGQIESVLARSVDLAVPKEQPRGSFLHDSEPLPEMMQPALESLEAAALLGQRTAELHLALAAPSENAAFVPEPITSEDLAYDADRVEAQLKATLDALRLQLASLDEATADAAALLLSRRVELIARARQIASLPVHGRRIRIHGDFHLGQTLRAGGDTAYEAKHGDFVFLDFEGEPARSLAERRRKQSPLKDVAGMLRSFSYAAHFALRHLRDEEAESTREAASDRLIAWARFWENAASTRFLQAYRQTIAANPALLPEPQSSQALLDVYLLEKALYELLYELNNRPTWLRIPIFGILSL
jgi:maltose alpha-D-glucosyltransferase/alpha-amylase